MASLTETANQLKGHTILYFPSDDLSNTDLVRICLLSSVISLVITTLMLVVALQQVLSDKELMQRLEITVIHWTRQIKEVVSNPEMAHHMDNTGPLEEIEVAATCVLLRCQHALKTARASLQVWRSRTVDLSGISEQLNRPEVKRIMEILLIAGSPYVKDFDDQAAMIQTGALAARSLLASTCFRLRFKRSE
jgi:dynein heavy chain